MITIQANAKGTRFIEVTDEHIATIQQYNLLSGLVGSNSMVTEETLESLRMQVRALLENNPQDEALLNLCQNVIFHDNMKALGLENLIEKLKEL